MRHSVCRRLLVLGVVTVGVGWDADLRPGPGEGHVTAARAVVGRPATPVSYAGVARRTTVRVATPGLGAPGVGVQPANRGGPVNRVGVR